MNKINYLLETQLHPVAQVTFIIVGGIVILGIFLACFTEFWDNIATKK